MEHRQVQVRLRAIKVGYQTAYQQATNGDIRVSGENRMPSSAYHRKQADTLTLLANSTRDRTAARALMRMAAEHVI
jgi:hypothetical protein